MTFAVNHLAYFLLTLSLMDLLKASAPARIVNVSSAAHRGAKLDFDDLMMKKSYNGWTAYSRSKLANLLFAYELARRLEGTGVTANAMHPGWVATGFGRDNGLLGEAWLLLTRLFAIGPEKGARTVVYLATSPDVAGVSGGYFVHERAVQSSPASLDAAAAKRLWQVSLDLTGVPDVVLAANRRRIVDFFPTTHRGPFGFPIRQRIVEISGGTRTSSRSYVSSRIPSGVYNVPRGQPSAAAPRRTSCTTNSQRDNALSVSASLADPSTTSARHWAASRPGSTSGGAATCKPAPKDSMT